MNYILDYSANGTEWIEAARAGGNFALEELIKLGNILYDKGNFVNIWDEYERLVWRDGRIAGEFYQLSPFEQEWIRLFGNLSIRYESTILFEENQVNL